MEKASKLAWYKMSLAALNKGHFSEQRQLKEVGEEHMVSCKAIQQSDAGVAFADRSDIVGKLSYIFRRAIRIKPPLREGKVPSTDTAYAPTLTGYGTPKDKFFALPS
ncbi:hypothetical protein AAHC03_013633 [Spirometra sp. Aus1]